jgi:hypothetical protein
VCTVTTMVPPSAPADVQRALLALLCEVSGVTGHFELTT